jgi:hypothetical protein
LPNQASTSKPSSKTPAAPGRVDPGLRAELERASSDLVYSSESDRPFEFFAIPLPGRSAPPSASDFARLIGRQNGDRAEEKSLVDFFARHTATSDPYDSEAQRIRPRYEALMRTISTKLRGVRVYRLGRIEIDCFIAGLDTHGNLVGLKTVAIET